MTSRPAKSPQQARSVAHVDRLLDAAAALIAQRGVEGMTMAAVGAAASSAPGSLYQYFPNRDALVDALATREAVHIERCIEEPLARWAAGGRHDPAALIDALLPPLLEHYRAHPAWGELLHALARRGAPGMVEQTLDQAVLARLHNALALLAPGAADSDAALAARVLLDMGHAGLLSALGDVSFYAEVRRCLIAYLAAWRLAQAE